MKKILTFCLAVLGIATVQAEIRVPAVISDHMVLQQETNARLWGWATPQSQLTVETSWDGKVYQLKVNDNGRWDVAVTTPKATFTPQSITINEYKLSRYNNGRNAGRLNAIAGANQYDNESQIHDCITINDILIGEVWLASGQSNMEMPLKGFPGAAVLDGTSEAMNAFRHNPGVRMMVVKLDQKAEEQTNCEGVWTDAHFPNPMNWSATAYFFAASLTQSLQVPVGIVDAAYGGATVESWTNREILSQYPDIDLNIDHIWAMEPHYLRPLLMYNAMFCPIKDFTYKGVIWYQGCSNVGKGPSSTEYAQRFANMVKLWRKEINLGEIPFLYVEIAPYKYDGDQEECAAYLREQQYKAQDIIPNSFMISTNNLVETWEQQNIHPRQKRKVGERLCWAALNRAYNIKQVCCAGPRYKSLDIVNDTCLVSFTDLQMGICRNYDIQGFEVAGEDRIFYPADMTKLRWQTNQVLVRSDSVAKPVAVRYCFHDFQVGTLIGGNELPAFPFRTDNWEREDKKPSAPAESTK